MRAGGEMETVVLTEGDDSWESSSHIAASDRLSLNYFAEEKQFFILHLISIPEHPLILGGNSTKPCSSFVSGSGGLISCN